MRKCLSVMVLGLVASSLAGGCGGSDDPEGSGGNAGSGGARTGFTCHDPAPAGARTPPPPPVYSGGSCPALVPGLNDFESNGPRQFILVLPADSRPDEKLPLIFLWHWLGGEANDFLERGEVQKAVDSQRFIAVIPEARADVLFKWPFSLADQQASVDQELQFFDDMLACVSAQFSVNSSCVATAGVSAGALWSGQLASYRGDYLSSFLSLSGGTGTATIKPWGNPDNKMPALVLWGGEADTCIVVNFQDTSRDLEQNLTSNGHFFLECVHNCMHGQPPFPPGTSSAFEVLWQFVFDHPYWLEPGQSPYLERGIPASFPEWCGIGANSATIRAGECPPPAC
jgi:predicted esterase